MFYSCGNQWSTLDFGEYLRQLPGLMNKEVIVFW